MRRVIMALLATTMGTIMLVGLKSQAFGIPLGLVAEEPLDPVTAGDGDPGTPTDATTAEPTAGPSAKPGTPPRPGASTATVKPTATTPAQTQTTAAATSKTYTGAAVAVKTAQSPNTRQSPCGDCHSYSMSVTITVTGGKITKATVVYSPSPGGSLSYANKARDRLSPKILTSQTWNLGPVSGATYSANAWELSAKDAMAKAGLPT